MADSNYLKMKLLSVLRDLSLCERFTYSTAFWNLWQQMEEEKKENNKVK